MGGRTTHTPPRQMTDDAGGAHFEATFNFTGCPPGEMLPPGTTFQWVQIVITNRP